MAYKTDPDKQEAIATARYVRMSPTKARQVIDLIRGRHVEDARRVLQFTARGASPVVAKVLNSAIANAEHNGGLPSDELVVTRAWVDEGPTLKRFRPRAQGRATRIRKRTCHIALVVGRAEDAVTVIDAPATKDERRPRKLTSRSRKAAASESSQASETAPKPSSKTTAKKTTAKKTTAKKTTAKKTTARKTTARSAAGGRAVEDASSTDEKTTKKKTEGEDA